MTAGDWKLLGGFAFIVIGIWLLCLLLWWIGEHWDDRKENN